MVTAIRELISDLNDLTETCRDSEEGFRHAAQHAENAALRSLFDTYSRQAARSAAELQAEVRRLGGHPKAADLFDSQAACGWITITDKLKGEDEIAILAECGCGVDAAERSYAAVLAKGLPAEVLPLLERQHTELKEVRDRIHALAGHHRLGPRRPCGEKESALPHAPERVDRPPRARRGSVRREPDASDSAAVPDRLSDPP